MKFKGKKFNYVFAKKNLPNGRVAWVDVIEHPGASLIIPFLTRDKIIFLRQYRAVIGRYLYELPAGTLDKGESPLSCAKRELIEETGRAGRVIRKIGEIYPVPGYSTEIIYIFKAEKLFIAQADKDPDEIIETVILSRRQIRQFLAQGKIKDAKTICALALAGI